MRSVAINIKYNSILRLYCITLGKNEILLFLSCILKAEMELIHSKTTAKTKPDFPLSMNEQTVKHEWVKRKENNWMGLQCDQSAGFFIAQLQFGAFEAYH